MIVYRFERNGLGPYVQGAGGVTVALRGSKKTTRTQKKAECFFAEQLRIDGYKTEEYQKAHANKEYIYGCKSKQSLRAYFNGAFKALFKKGYRIKRYVVPDEEVLDMNYEVAFPVKYHKLQSLRSIEKKIKAL